MNTLSFTTLTNSVTSKVLIAANIIPLLGVLFFDWDLNFVLILYWVENIVIGIFNLLKMLCLPNVNIAERLFKSAFFMVHYGGFCAGHGSFLFFFLDIPLPELPESEHTDNIFLLITSYIEPTFNHLYHLFGNPFIGSLGALFLSHGVSLIDNFLIKGERKVLKLMTLFSLPYPRIIVLHITIIAGGFLVQTLGSPTAMLALLVLIKIVIDLSLHRREHQTIQVQNPH